jgi:hypothetical protein
MLGGGPVAPGRPVLLAATAAPGRSAAYACEMLDFVTRTVRSVLGDTEHDVADTVHETRDIESNMLDAVQAIENATASIERHVEVIETLATSVDPLRASVDRLTDTMQDLVALLGPIAAAEHEEQKLGRMFRRHRHDDKPPVTAEHGERPVPQGERPADAPAPDTAAPDAPQS